MVNVFIRPTWEFTHGRLSLFIKHVRPLEGKINYKHAKISTKKTVISHLTPWLYWSFMA